MTQNVEQADTVVRVDKDVEDFLYYRVGYVDQGRKSDLLLAGFLRLLPGDGRLPLRWHYRSHERFLAKHGHLGLILWAASNNSHLLMINGFHILRIWTDTADSCWVDLADNLAGSLSQPTPMKRKGEVQDIPAGNAKKCKPFTKRVKVWQQFQMQGLADLVKRIYGLDNERLRVSLWTQV